jgi:hypothetical protein
MLDFENASCDCEATVMHRNAVPLTAEQKVWILHCCWYHTVTYTSPDHLSLLAEVHLLDVKVT